MRGADFEKFSADATTRFYIKSVSNINSLKPSYTQTRYITRYWSLVQIMPCPIFGSKPLADPNMPYRQLDRKELILVKF